MKKMFPMIITFVIIFLASISVTGQQPAKPAAVPATRPQFRMPPRIVSPEILTDINSYNFR